MFILTDQGTKAYDDGENEVSRGSDDSGGEHLHFAVNARVSFRANALVFAGRLKVTAPAAILAREPVALVHVHAVHALLLIASTATDELHQFRRDGGERSGGHRVTKMRAKIMVNQ